MPPARLLSWVPFGLVLACSNGAGPPTQNEEPATPAPGRTHPVVIGALQTHDAKVSILGGHAGRELRVVVRKHDGTLVADDATLDELRVLDPETWRVVTSAVAQGDGTFLDATYVAPRSREIH